jgi:hypothetical protein
LLDAIVDAPGISKTELHEVTGKRYSADARAKALAWLQQNGLAHSQECPLAQGGPPAERWYPGPGPEPPSADRKPQTADREADAQEDVPQTADRKPQTVPDTTGRTDCGLRTADGEPQTAEPSTACGLRSADADAEGVRSPEGKGFVVDAHASADLLRLMEELDVNPPKPFQTPWAGLTALLTPDTLAFILYDSDRRPHYRLVFEADAEALANLRRQHPDLQARLTPFWTEADAEDYRRRFPYLKRLPHADTWHVEFAVEADAHTPA